jgi:hypothetical protein
VGLYQRDDFAQNIAEREAALAAHLLPGLDARAWSGQR